MESLQYNVIFSGNIAGEQQLESVKQHLMTKFNLSPQRVEASFQGNRLSSKKTWITRMHSSIKLPLNAQG